MNYIKELTLGNKLANRIKHCSPVFLFNSGVSVLAGSNGSGKSTILEAISNAGNKFKRTSEKDKDVQIKLNDNTMVSFKSFDFEKGNPRTLSYIKSGVERFQLSARWSSHGETNRALIKGLLDDKEVKDCILLLDEPEQALDFDGMKLLIDCLENCKATQTIVASHAIQLLLHTNFNKIELESGYIDKVREFTKKLI